MNKQELPDRPDARVDSNGPATEARPISDDISGILAKNLPTQFQLPESIEVKVGFLLKREVPVGPKLLAIIMRIYARDGICQIPQKRLCEITGIEKRTISRWSKQLVTLGIITPVSKVRDEGKPIAYRLR